MLEPEGRRQLQLKQMTNGDLLQLYDSEIKLRLHNPKNLRNTRKMPGRFQVFLAGRAPSPELAKAFLAQFIDRARRALYRYTQMIKAFMKWYGEPVDDFKVKVPKTLPPYTEDSAVEKVISAIESKKTHRGCTVRDVLLIELAVKTGMRRGELAELEVRDVHADFLVVRNGKGGKDRVIPLSPAMTLGKEGCVVSTSKEWIQAPQSNLIENVDTTGAGNAFSAGFMVGRLRGMDMAGCARLGNEAAASFLREKTVTK